MATPASPVAKTAATLSRELNLFHLTMMGVGMMIGAGAVIGMGLSIRLAGPGGTLLAFAFDGLVALFTALSYAEMSSAVPKAGSIYNFARIAFGRGTGFTAGWISWFASSVAGTFYAVICAEYSIDFLAQFGLLDWLALSNFWQVRLLAIGITLLFVWINYRGVSSTGSSASLLTLGQTITLGFIGLFGVVVFILHPERLANFRPFLPRGWSGVLVCMGVEYIAFEGYEVIAEAGDEAIEPRRNLPKAILYSVLIVTVTYVLVAFSLIAGVKNVGLPAWEWLGSFGEKGFGKAMEQLMPLGSFLAVLTVIFAATSALNSTIYSATRASYALGRDRMLPGFLGRISSRRSTPHVALLATRGHHHCVPFPAHHRHRLRGQHHVPVPVSAGQPGRDPHALEHGGGAAVRLPHAPLPAVSGRRDHPPGRSGHFHHQRELGRLGGRPVLDRPWPAGVPALLPQPGAPDSGGDPGR